MPFMSVGCKNVKAERRDLTKVNTYEKCMEKITALPCVQQ